MAMIQKPGWTPSIRGLVPRPVSDAFEYLRNTLTSVRTQQDAINKAPSVGIGNGTSGNVTAPALGTGKGPKNPNLIIGWRQVTDSSGNTYFIPMMQ